MGKVTTRLGRCSQNSGNANILFWRDFAQLEASKLQIALSTLIELLDKKAIELRNGRVGLTVKCSKEISIKKGDSFYCFINGVRIQHKM